MSNEREEIAKENGMSMEFVNWFFDNKKDTCGNLWLPMLAAMWEGWKVREQQLTESQSKLERMAAENSKVKAMNDCLSEELRGYESDGAFEGPKMHLLWWKTETPATDAFLAEVRASGVETFAASLKVVGPLEHPYSAVAKEFAAQLRQGGAV